MLNQLSVGELLAAMAIITTVILGGLNIADKMGWGKTRKRVTELEQGFSELKREFTDIKKLQETDSKERRLMMRAILSLLPEGNPVKNEMLSYLSDK